MGFEFGMFHEFQRPAGISDEQAFATSFEQVDAAERWGLDAMWLAEIHVAPERSVLLGAVDPGQRDRRPHQADEDRHRRSRYCRCAIRCASPRRSRRSIRSAMAG